MFNVKVTNIDQDTVEAITYLAKSVGGKVQKLRDIKDDNNAGFRKKMQDIRGKIIKKHNVIADDKIK